MTAIQAVYHYDRLIIGLERQLRRPGHTREYRAAMRRVLNGARQWQTHYVRVVWKQSLTTSGGGGTNFGKRP